MASHILSIDQGTTSSRALLFDETGAVVTSSQYEFTQHFPNDGWVEHDPEQIWHPTLRSCLDVLKKAGQVPDSIGITNQRETTLIWERASGKPIYNAIVWQDRRTADYCQSLMEQGYGDDIADRTGLLIDAYFSASKIAWILDRVDGARARAERGELAFGTVDSFIVWRLTNGRVHATDATNASRTMLFNIHTQKWDEALLTLFGIPPSLLPDVRDCADDYGVSDPDILGITCPIGGVVGDQQGALFGQACFKPGMVKSTFGTGCFMVMNTGENPVRSSNKLLTTVGYRLNGEVTYALEGSIFNAGTAVQWLRDGLGLINNVDEIDGLIASTSGNDGVYMVPAFTGLGAPHWDSNARGSITGITRDTGVAHLVRAALEAVCYQSFELTDAMVSDSKSTLTQLRVDGGMVANDWLLQFLADVIDTEVERPNIIETTALGAAYLAGLQQGIFQSKDEISALWNRSRCFKPNMDQSERQQLLTQWQVAIESVKSSSHR